MALGARLQMNETRTSISLPHPFWPIHLVISVHYLAYLYFFSLILGKNDHLTPQTLLECHLIWNLILRSKQSSGFVLYVKNRWM